MRFFSWALLLSGCRPPGSTCLCLFVFLPNIPPHLPPWPSFPTALCPHSFLCRHRHLFRHKLAVRPKLTQLVAWPGKSTWNIKDGQPAPREHQLSEALWTHLCRTPEASKHQWVSGSLSTHSQSYPVILWLSTWINQRTRPPVLSWKSSFRGEENK